MSQYAKIENNIVINIIDCNESEILTQSGEHIKVSDYTNHPVIGLEYDKLKNKFNQIQPYPSWIQNEDLIWISPEGLAPTDARYIWNEDLLAWKKLGE